MSSWDPASVRSAQPALTSRAAAGASLRCRLPLRLFAAVLSLRCSLSPRRRGLLHRAVRPREDRSAPIGIRPRWPACFQPRAMAGIHPCLLGALPRIEQTTLADAVPTAGATQHRAKATDPRHTTEGQPETLRGETGMGGTTTRKPGLEDSHCDRAAGREPLFPAV